jgi:NitT/TauT family transport system substrate-binding protein
VFSERWAASHGAAIEGFLAAAQAARDLLASSPEEWQKIAPLARVDDPKVLARLRQAYRRGIAQGEPAAAVADQAQKLLALLVELGGIDEAPPGGRVPAGTFFARSGS